MKVTDWICQLIICVLLMLTSSCEKNDDDKATVFDIDGNRYHTITVGTQVWMAENLKVTHYHNGTTIQLVEDDSAWEALGCTDKAYCYYYNRASDYGDTYGALYTWAAAMNGAGSSDTNPSGVQGVCPDGWHLPSDEEWKELEMYLGMSQAEADGTVWRGTDEGGKLKETGTILWNSPNTGATNSSGFSGLPGGSRAGSGMFNYIGRDGGWWSATEDDTTYAWARRLNYNHSGVGRYYGYKGTGFSVRCVRD